MDVHQFCCPTNLHAIAIDDVASHAVVQDKKVANWLAGKLAIDGNNNY